jgi:hypothetical protein
VKIARIAMSAKIAEIEKQGLAADSRRCSQIKTGGI